MKNCAEPIQSAVKTLSCRAEDDGWSLRCLSRLHGGSGVGWTKGCSDSEQQWAHLQQPLQQVVDGVVLGGSGVVAQQLTSNHLSAEVGELDA